MKYSTELMVFTLLLCAIAAVNMVLHRVGIDPVEGMLAGIFAQVLLLQWTRKL